MPFVSTPFNLRRLLRGIPADFDPILTEKGIPFGYFELSEIPKYPVFYKYPTVSLSAAQLTTSTRHVTGNAERIKEVICELLSNRIKFATTGKVTLTVKFSTLQGGSYIGSATIADSGYTCNLAAKEHTIWLINLFLALRFLRNN